MKIHIVFICFLSKYKYKIRTSKEENTAFEFSDFEEEDQCPLDTDDACDAADEQQLNLSFDSYRKKMNVCKNNTRS